MEGTTDKSSVQALRVAMAQALAENRRGASRFAVFCTVSVRWHHEPQELRQYEAIDLSETGVRVRTDRVLPEGLTGRVRWSSSPKQDEDRPLMVVWSRPIHTPDGEISHFEAGLRLF